MRVFLGPLIDFRDGRLVVVKLNSDLMVFFCLKTFEFIRLSALDCGGCVERR